MGIKYFEFIDLTSSKYQRKIGTVVNQYTKTNTNGKIYYILKIKTKNFTMVTTSWEDLKDIKNSSVRFSFFSDKIDFLDYFRGFYAVSFDISLLREQSATLKLSKILDQIHNNSLNSEFYKALFFGFVIPKELRDSVTSLGIAHLIAISGLHLSIFTIFLFSILSFLYKPLQNRFFPYRNRFIDVSFMILIVLSCYLYFLGFIPSLARAFLLWLIGSYLYSRGIEIISFYTLLIVVLLLIGIYPEVVINIGFWLSVIGVFYIFLYLKHFKFKLFDIIYIHVILFFLVSIYSIYFFNQISIYQLISIPLSMIFNIFYPLVILLHTIGFGDLFDSYLSLLFSSNFPIKSVKIEESFIVPFTLLSLLSIKHKNLFIFLIFISMVVFFYLVYVQ